MTGYELQLYLRYRNSIWNKETEKKYCSSRNVLTIPVSCTGSYIEDEPNFPWQKKSHFTGKGVLRRQGCEFQGLFKTTSKIQDLFKIVRTMKTQVWTRQPLHWSLNFTRVNRKDADASTNAMWKLLELCMMLKWELVSNCACVCVGRVNNSCACVAHVS